MPTIAAIGHSFALDGREACIQAIEEARQKILHEADNIVMAFIFASREYNLTAILSGATAQLRTIPLFGFSTEAQVATTGQYQRAIVVALLAGDDITVEANWWPDFSTNSAAKIQEMVNELEIARSAETQPLLMLAADGIHGDHEAFGKTILNPPMLVGALTGGMDRLKSAFQIGGGLGGEHGLSAVLFQGNIKAGVGVAHGWQSVGKYFELSRVEDLWIRKLDNQPAAEMYAALFGQQARDWAFPPLNRLIRLYPLGIETEAQVLKVSAPLLVEVDGSFRMTSHLQEGGTGHLMVGSAASCLDAAHRAAQQALSALGNARPILGLIFADIAWKMLFETQPGHELAPIREVLGPHIPLAGGYTLGQLYKHAGGIEVLNQHLEIVLLGVED
jgi:hypothetical protein